MIKRSERSINALRRVHNYTCTTMGIDRVSAMSLLAIERDISDIIDALATYNLRPNFVWWHNLTLINYW